MPASFRMLLSKNPSDALDFYDDFTTDALHVNYVTTNGSQTFLDNWSIVNNQLTVAVLSSNQNFLLKQDMGSVTDVETTMKFNTGAVIGHDLRPVLRYLDTSNRIQIRHTGATLQIQKLDGGATSTLATKSTGVLAINASYYLKCSAKGNDITAEIWLNDPNIGSNALVTTLSTTLTGADAIKFGASVEGQVGWFFNTYGSDYTFDDFRVHPLSIDIAQYTRVTPGDGLDPANSEYLDPMFADSPLRDGGPLINIDAKNREFHVPMHVNANTKDNLWKKMAAINRALQEPGVQLEWRDDGATRSTFFDVQAGRLDQEYNFRRAQKFWGSCTAVIWGTPYGHTNASRVVGTLSGSGAVQGMPVEPMSNDPSNMIQSGDFELGVLGVGSWTTGANFLFNAGGSIIQPQAVPTNAPAFVGDYVMRVWCDGTTINEGARVPFTFPSGNATQLYSMMRIRTPRAGSYPMTLSIHEQAGNFLTWHASLVVGTQWTTASVVTAQNPASLSGSWMLYVRTGATDIPSLTFEIDQVVVTQSPPSLSIPSMLEGDVGAKAVWQVTAGSQVLNSAIQLGRYIGVAALPASYNHRFGAASIIGTFNAPPPNASGAQDGSYLIPGIVATGAQDLIGKITLSPADAYVGRNRVYMVGRSYSEPNVRMYMADWENQRVGPTVIASGVRDWHLYDMGVINVPTAGRASQLAVTFYGRPMNDASSLFPGAYAFGSAGGSAFFHLNEIIVLPEANHSLLTDDVDVPSQIVFDDFFTTGGPINFAASSIFTHTSDTGHTWATSLVATVAIPSGWQFYSVANDAGGQLSPQATAGYASQYSIGVRIPSLGLTEFRIQAGFNYPGLAASLPASHYFGVRKEISTVVYYGARVGASQAAAGGAYFSCDMVNAGATFFASTAIPTINVFQRYRIVLEARKAFCAAYLLADDAAAPTLLMASAGFTGAFFFDRGGDPGIYSAQGSNAGYGVYVKIDDFRVESVPTQRIAPRDIYVLDGIAGEAYRRPQGGDIQQRLTHKLRGQIPRVPVPSSVRLVGFALGLPEGTANDLTDVQVSLREQFRFAR